MWLCIWCLRWLPVVLRVTSWNMQVRLSAIWQWRDVLPFATFLLKWVRVVVWLLRMKWLLNISKDVKVLRKAKHGTRLWLIGRHWRVMMMPCLIKKSVSKRLILNRWLPTERIRVWVWESHSIFLLWKEWVKLHRFRSRNQWSIWDSNRVNLCWVRRLIMYSLVLVQTVVLKISVHLLPSWKVVRKRRM